MAVALSVVVYPLLRPESGRALRFAAPAGPLEDLLSRRDAAYAGIKELEFEHELGNLSREDFQALRDEYRFKAARLLQEIESAAQARDHDAAAAGPASASDEIEHAVRRLRERRGQPTAHKACPLCREAVSPGDRYCPSCGAMLSRFCAVCGEAREPGHRFCRYCGAPAEASR